MDLPFYTANVLVSTSREDIETIFINPDASLSTRRKSISEIAEKSDKTFLFAPGLDSGLISLTDSFLFEQEPLITLEFIDPGKDFENVFLRSDFSNPLASLVTTDTSDLKKLAPHASDKQIEESAEYNVNFNDQIIDEMVGLDGLGQGFINTIYIAYGSDVDTTKWTVQSCMLIDAEISLEKGSREITLKFIPSFDPLSIEKLLANYRDRLHGEFLKEARAKKLTEIIEAQAKPLTEYYKDGEVAYHSLFVDILKNYLSRVTGIKDVFVLIPDTEVVFKNTISLFKEQNKPFDNSAKKQLFYFGKSPTLTPQGEHHVQARDLNLICSFSPISFFLQEFGISVIKDHLGAYHRDLMTVDTLKKINKGAFGPQNWIPMITKEVPREGEDSKFRDVLDTFEAAYTFTQYIPKFTNHIQTNLKVLDIWKKHKLIGSDATKVLVYGDERLIHEHLYFSNNYTETDAIARDYEGHSAITHDPDHTLSVEKAATAVRLMLKGAERQVALNSGKLTEEAKEQIARLRGVLEEFEKQVGGVGFPSNILRVEDKKKYSVIKDDIEKLNTSHSKEKKSKDLLKRIKEKSDPLKEAILHGVTKLGFPVFRSNTASVHDNIKSINLKLQKHYFTSLFVGYKTSTIARLATQLADDPDKVTKMYGKQGKVDFETFMDAIKNNTSINTGEELIKKALKDKNLKKYFTTRFTEYDENKFILFILTSLILSTSRSASTNISNHKKNINPIATQLHVLEELTKRAYTVDIETTPMFHLSGPHVKNKHCVLFSNDFDIHGILKKTVRFRRDQVYDGVYVLFGYEHTISASEVSSKFNLTKVPNLI